LSPPPHKIDILFLVGFRAPCDPPVTLFKETDPTAPPPEPALRKSSHRGRQTLFLLSSPTQFSNTASLFFSSVKKASKNPANPKVSPKTAQVPFSTFHSTNRLFPLILLLNSSSIPRKIAVCPPDLSPPPSPATVRWSERLPARITFTSQGQE